MSAEAHRASFAAAVSAQPAWSPTPTTAFERSERVTDGGRSVPTETLGQYQRALPRVPACGEHVHEFQVVGVGGVHQISGEHHLASDVERKGMRHTEQPP